MKNNRRKSAATIAELAAITLLSMTLVILFVQYCLLKNSSSISTATHPDHSFLENDDIHTEDDFSSPGIVVPEFIGFVSDSKQLSPVSSEARRRLISETRPFITEVFSDISTVMEFSSESAKNEYLENTLAAQPSYIYFRFAHDLPAGCFVPAIGGYTLDSIFHSFNVKDLYIFCSDTGEISGMALDSNGNLTALSVRDRSALSFEDFSSLDSSDGMVKFEFASFADRKYPVLTSTVAFRNIAAYTDTEDFTVDNDDAVSAVLDSFGFNPNSTSFYRTDDTLTYVEQTGELSLASDGSITYSSSGAGIPISEFVNSSKEVFSFEEKILAARSVINRLDKAVFGGYAVLSLYSVSYDEGLLTVSFAYTSDGILIESTKGCATIVFDGASLIHADIKAKKFAKLESSYTDIPQKLLFAFSSKNFDVTALPAGFPIVYSENDNSVFVAKSAILYQNAGGKETIR